MVAQSTIPMGDSTLDNDNVTSRYLGLIRLKHMPVSLKPDLQHDQVERVYVLLCLRAETTWARKIYHHLWHRLASGGHQDTELMSCLGLRAVTHTMVLGNVKSINLFCYPSAHRLA